MKIYKIFYFDSDEYLAKVKIGVQYTTDENLVKLLMENELKLEENIEIVELELEEEECISQEQWGRALNHLNYAYGEIKKSNLGLDSFATLLKIKNLQIRYEKGERTMSLYEEMTNIY